MTSIEHNPDGTVAVSWKGRKGGGSLLQVMAKGNADLVNQLNIKELLTVLLCVKEASFPMGQGEKVYRTLSEHIDKQTAMIAMAEQHGIAWLRELLINQAGEGCNAPTDSYLRIAADIATGKDHIHRY